MTDHAVSPSQCAEGATVLMDPTVQAIENYDAAERDWQATPRDTPEWEEAERRWWATEAALFNTPPTSPEGAAAFIDFALQDDWEWGRYTNGADRAAMVAIRDVLKQLGAAS